jgi:aldose sugar dehydrogenase
MRHLIIWRSLAIASACAVIACGGGSSPTSPSPSPGPSPGPGNVTITVLGDRGNQSFTPNPSTVQQGQSVVWRNTDAVVHRIRFNDGSAETADIAPGATSAAIVMQSDGANYHCPLHPGMIGSINSSSGAPPDCVDPLYC